MSKAIMLFAGKDATEEFDMLNDRKVIKKYGIEAISAEFIKKVIKKCEVIKKVIKNDSCSASSRRSSSRRRNVMNKITTGQ